MMGYIEDIHNVANVDLPWDKLRGKNILVTGATGLIGSTIIDVLMNRDVNYHVYASGRNVRRAKLLFAAYQRSCFFHFIEWDVTQPLCYDINFHYVICAASGANPVLYATDPVGVMRSNLFGVDTLLSYGINHGLQKFVYISSGEIYGEGDGRVFSEDYSGYVNCATIRACYPSSKRAAETLCVAYSAQYDIDVSIARLSHIYGPRFTESDNRVYAQFIKSVLQDEDIVMKSDGRQFRSWCYSVDCASAILYILLKGKGGEAYNVADENSNINIRDLAELIARKAGKRVLFKIPSEREKMGFNPVTKSVFSVEKIKELGWIPYTDIIQGIEHTVNYLQARIISNKNDA